MKKILILLFIFLLAGCLPEKEKAPLSHFINVRLANGVFQIKLEPAVAPGAAEHFLNLIKQNVYDGAILGTKDSMLFIYPDSNLEIIKTKIAEEKSAITKKAMIFGLVRSPIVEKGDSVFFSMFKRMLPSKI